MDNPGLSLFQNANIEINNSQNIEEEEDYEDQLRRKEELQNLLEAKIDAFNYDESTLNSSVSIASVDNLEENYKNAISPDKQLKVLYDARTREIQELRKEYDKYKNEAKTEIDSLKHQNLLFEGELRQAQISWRNAEQLLVEKTESINALNKTLLEKDKQISDYENIIKNHEMDISAYKSEITELHLKLQGNIGPFNLNAKYNSEAFQKALQEKIDQLENALIKEQYKSENYSKDKCAFQEEVERLVKEKLELENVNRQIIKSFDDAQQQCQDLINLIESLKTENNHFKERLEQLEQNNLDDINTEQENSLNNTNISNSKDKLRRKLLDKAIEIDALKAQLKCAFEENMAELMEYRQLKIDVYKKDFTQCDNRSHTKDLLVLQNDLQNYRRIIDDKNQQILNLNANNKDLREKIEEMLLQTRNEIQSISSKYNVPKLEIMSNELTKAENTVKILNEKLEESEKQRLSLLKQFTSQDKSDSLTQLEICRKELEEIKLCLENEKLENNEICENLKRKNNEVLQLKRELEELKLKKGKLDVSNKSPSKWGLNHNFEDGKLKKDYDEIKKQLKQVMQHLEKNNSNNRPTPDIVNEIKLEMDNFLDRSFDENIEKNLLEEKIISWKKLLDKILIKDPDEILKGQYQKAVADLHISNEKIMKLEDAVEQLRNAKEFLQNENCKLGEEIEENRKKIAEIGSMRKNLENDTEQNKKIQEVLNQLQKNKLELLNNEEKLKNVEKMNKNLINQLEEQQKYNAILKMENEKQRQMTPDQNQENEKFAKAGTWEQKELELRDELQVEYQQKIGEIEKRYQKVCNDTKLLCKKQEEKLREQDKKCREYMALISTQCEKCIDEAENEKLALSKQLKVLNDEFAKYKKSVAVNEEKMMDKYRKELKETKSSWELWSKKVVSSCLDIEATNKNVRDRVLAQMQIHDQEVDTISKAFDKKIKKRKKTTKKP